jgi:hypothetical protein
LSDFFLPWYAPITYTFLPEFLEDLVAVAPDVMKIESSKIPNGLLTTALGKSFS